MSHRGLLLVLVGQLCLLLLLSAEQTSVDNRSCRPLQVSQ